jgi:RecB family exonuclease
VAQGLSQWEEALDKLTGSLRRDTAAEDREGWVDLAECGAAQEIPGKFRRFVARLSPPAHASTLREFTKWLFDLLGPVPNERGAPLAPSPGSNGLRVAERAALGSATVANRDLAALTRLGQVMRALVWRQEQTGQAERMDFRRFFREMAGAVESARYDMVCNGDTPSVLVADVVEARGLPFRAIAVLGMAEAQFPRPTRESALLRDEDRTLLRTHTDVGLQTTTESAEAEFFYETVTRARDWLLLTRPRLDDSGAPWEPSPFWEEVTRLVDVSPVILTTRTVPSPAEACSWQELMESAAGCRREGDLWNWIAEHGGDALTWLDTGAEILRQRCASEAIGVYDGDLGMLEDTLAERFGRTYRWSVSQLESYQTCPFLFFLTRALGLRAREEPAEGLDARQLGSIYHRILKEVYSHPGVSDPVDADQLRDALERVADRVLDAAPAAEGFRETAWWAQTRREIKEDLGRTLEELAALENTFVPSWFEAEFGLGDAPTLVIRDGDDEFRLGGKIDRIDRAPDGRLRVVDYKLGGPSAYSMRAHVEGDKVQVPLYALAAQDALKLGTPVEGFYWHVRQAKPSPFSMGRFGGGAEGAIQMAVDHAWHAVRGARAGHFEPRTPDGGCPSYCPAAAFCWRFRARHF